jgi:hypothetical protein
MSLTTLEVTITSVGLAKLGKQRARVQ